MEYLNQIHPQSNYSIIFIINLWVIILSLILLPILIQFLIFILILFIIQLITMISILLPSSFHHYNHTFLIIYGKFQDDNLMHLNNHNIYLAIHIFIFILIIFIYIFIYINELLSMLILRVFLYILFPPYLFLVYLSIFVNPQRFWMEVIDNEALFLQACDEFHVYYSSFDWFVPIEHWDVLLLGKVVLQFLPV